MALDSFPPEAEFIVGLLDEVQGDSERMKPSGLISESRPPSDSHPILRLAGGAPGSIKSCNTAVKSTTITELDCIVDLKGVDNSFTCEGACEKTKGCREIECEPFADTDYEATASTFLKGLSKGHI